MLTRLMEFCLTPRQNSYSNDKTDDKATMSQPDYEKIDEELFQPLTQQNAFQKAFGRPAYLPKKARSLHRLKSYEMLLIEFITRNYITRFLWKKVEGHEGVNGTVKHSILGTCIPG